MNDPFQQTTPSRATLSPALRGVLDAIDDTRTVAEVQALMKPYFEDKNCGADTVWRVWNEEKDKAETEERQRRPRHWSKKSICRSRMWGRIQQVVRRPRTAIDTMTERGFSSISRGCWRQSYVSQGLGRCDVSIRVTGTLHWREQNSSYVALQPLFQLAFGVLSVPALYSWMKRVVWRCTAPRWEWGQFAAPTDCANLLRRGDHVVWNSSEQ